MSQVIVVGAGVSGLTAAVQLFEAGVTVTVLDAMHRTGGRVHSLRNHHTSAVSGDLGPSWVWPRYQPVLEKLLSQLGIDTLPQFDTGLALIERDPGRPPVRQPLPSQHGLRRPVGGPQAIVDALMAKLPAATVKLNHQVLSIQSAATQAATLAGTASEPASPASTATELVVRVKNNATERTDTASDMHELRAAQVVLAVPLRIAQEHIQFTPTLPDTVQQVLQSSPTWMATQAKVLIVYDTPFWRADGLSGRVASSVGPLVEVHDMSVPNSSQGVLFGFVGWPQEQRSDTLGDAVLTQLVRLFGASAATPVELIVEDWATQPHICSTLDRTEPTQHPIQLPELIRQPLPGGRLHIAVAEMSDISPGLLEGAVQAGTQAARQVLLKLTRS